MDMPLDIEQNGLGARILPFGQKSSKDLLHWQKNRKKENRKDPKNEKKR